MSPHEELKELLHYCPDTGTFTWKKARGRCGAGKVVPAPAAGKYLRIAFMGKRELAHRLAWLYMTGDWPGTPIDHKDRDPTNCRWSNLRAATYSQNLHNSPCKKGYYKNRNKFTAQIRVDYKRINLGSYETEGQARAAYELAAYLLFGEYAYDH